MRRVLGPVKEPLGGVAHLVGERRSEPLLVVNHLHGELDRGGVNAGGAFEYAPARRGQQPHVPLEHEVRRQLAAKDNGIVLGEAAAARRQGDRATGGGRAAG